MEKKALRLYNHALKRLEQQLGTGATYGNDLNRVGEEHLGKKFAGVYPADMLPLLSKKKCYAILNLDKSDMPGSHWIGVKYLGKGKVLVYDSFGRKTQRIIPSLTERYTPVDADYDAEQENREDNCGPRSLAFLVVDDLFGTAVSRKI
jgi:hypothetical protein